MVANRGEIAVRILRACKELGISTVAVFSDADQSALHVRLADEAVRIGPPEVSHSYLNGEKIISVATETGAEAIHPGYGLLSENAQFAELVELEGMVFIGPSVEAIRIMGDKSLARELMQNTGIPVVPGSKSAIRDIEDALETANSIGYPVLIKSAAGGGGKGMRIAKSGDEIFDMADSAQRESIHSFGDGRLLIERYIPNAHHVEFQILGDQHGHIIHLFERECSVQRRHQKIIEETPSPILDDQLRAKMSESAIRAARAVNYSSTGTIEFLVDPSSGQFYFLEMNTRLQVEHPITELVTGMDLVKWQIRISAGEPIPFSNQDIEATGHAIECRLYAEDPEQRFLPASGKVLHFSAPRGPGIRVDSGIANGDEITVYYDPLIAKIITFSEDRDSAIRKMISALSETVLLGLTSNLRFLQDVLDHPDFKHGKVFTTWVEQNFSDWKQPRCGIEPEILIAAALGETSFFNIAISDQKEEKITPWMISDHFRIGSGNLRGDS